MLETYYVGTLDADGETIAAVAGPFDAVREASDVRISLVGPERKYSLRLIVHRPPRAVRMVTLEELQRIQNG